jgi:hypothetical protein
MESTIDCAGFATVPRLLTAAECDSLISVLEPVAGAGRRGLLGSAAVSKLARSEQLLNLVRPHLSLEPRPVRAIYFDKSAAANWGVAWHQDLTLAVRTRVEVHGFGPWSTKDGISHVQPPVELLERMLTVRLHLDCADAANGALRVLPGSHRFGRLAASRIAAMRVQQSDHLCTATAGDALLMRPLLLHASSRSTTERRRRILHIEYAGFDLPGDLEWHEAS